MRQGVDKQGEGDDVGIYKRCARMDGMGWDGMRRGEMTGGREGRRKKVDFF